MEKALERDASLRYQTASEFGRSLHAAVAKMPLSAVVEMGTRVMGAAARTRGASHTCSQRRSRTNRGVHLASDASGKE